MRKIAIVTGASRGIGKAIAVKLARDGYKIWGVFRENEQKATEVKRKIEEGGGSCLMLKVDVANLRQVEDVVGSMLEEIDEREERLWALVNNAGIVKDVLFVWMKKEEWDRVISVNLGGAFNMTKVTAEKLLRNRGGRIVNITSVSALMGNAGQSAYSASKAGLIGFTKSLAKELARARVTVNCIAAGFVRTDMTSSLPEKELKKTIPMRRFGEPEEIADVVSFLCSESAGYITGAIIDVNGGLF